MLFCHENTYSESLTFQFLLSAHVSSMRDYQACSSAILEALGNKYRYFAVSEFLDDILKNFLMMTKLLLESNLVRLVLDHCFSFLKILFQYDHLGALLELLRAIVIHMPASATYLLNSSQGAQDYLTECLKSIVTECNNDANSKQGASTILHPMLVLLETLVWLLPDHLSDQ